MTAEPRFLDIKGVADELAVSERQIYSILRTGELPAIQVGPKKVWRIERTMLEHYIEQQYAATRSSVEAGDVEDDGDED